MAASYINSFAPSFLETKTDVNFSGSTFSGPVTVGDIDWSNPKFSFDTTGKFAAVENLSGTDLLSTNYKPSWTFITAPEDVSWDLANQATRVDIFGTNNPPVVAGSRGMRDLTLSNSLVEGFVRNVTVESKISALEDLLNYKLNSTDGFVSVPVYQVWANEKSYGGPEAYYIIKDVKVNEKMRDLKGNTTRATVDISLMQVPAYQVNTGRDQASAVTAGAKSGLLEKVKEQANQKVEGAAKKGGNAAKAAGTKPNAGPGTGKTGTSTIPKNDVGVLNLRQRGQRSVKLNLPQEP